MIRHLTRISSALGLAAPLRFGAAAVWILAMTACSSGGRGGLDEGQIPIGSGGSNAGASGASAIAGLGGQLFADDVPPGGDAGSGGSAGAFADAGAPDPYVLPPSVTLGEGGEVMCGSSPCACNNGVDDDGDGTIDGFDEECTGALDNDEAAFATGIPGDNSDPKWQDCFFDGNSGAGDDHCRYHADCLTGDKPASDPDCAVSAECHDFCAARTPNGCDCFGCCSVQRDDGTSVSVFIGGSCTSEDVDDPARCPRCTPSTACGNTCGECELCPGKSVEDVPASCGETPGGGGSEPPAPAYSCDDGHAVCSGTSDCAGGQYCSLGCCLDFVIY